VSPDDCVRGEAVLRILTQLADAREELADARVDLPDDRGNGNEAEEEDRREQCEVSREDRDHPRHAPASEEFDERLEPQRDDTARTTSPSRERIT